MPSAITEPIHHGTRFSAAEFVRRAVEMLCFREGELAITSPEESETFRYYRDEMAAAKNETLRLRASTDEEIQDESNAAQNAVAATVKDANARTEKVSTELLRLKNAIGKWDAEAEFQPYKRAALQQLEQDLCSQFILPVPRRIPAERWRAERLNALSADGFRYSREMEAERDRIERRLTAHQRLLAEMERLAAVERSAEELQPNDEKQQESNDAAADGPAIRRAVAVPAGEADVQQH